MPLAPEVGFQSLSGFFRPCNTSGGRGGGMSSVVSIPVGFFQALQPQNGTGSPLQSTPVSIPVGFFQALQLSELHVSRRSL